MPAKRLSMRKIREALRLKHFCGLSEAAISRSLCVARSTVADYLLRAGRAGLTWPLPEGLDDGSLESMLFPPSSSPVSRELPDFVHIHRELSRKGVTLLLLWEEYKRRHPDGYQYTRFCVMYREWAGRVDVVMRQCHMAGEKMFVDYAGQCVDVVDRLTGEVREAQVFVAVLGASSYTYAEATWTQSLPDWIGSHVRAFEYFGGAPQILVPDNLRSGISRSCRYEPVVNPAYAEMAAHYGVAVIPARAGKPRDKAKVEVGVLLVERWILARLRNQTFFSLASLNEAIGGLLGELNRRPFRKLPGSRLSLFEDVDKPALRPLPVTAYEFAQWKKARVNIDYHVEVDGHYYSVSYRLARQEVDIRVTAAVIEVFHRGLRAASHMRAFRKGAHTTVREHMPKSHQKYLEWTPSRIIEWAEKTGPATAQLAAAIMESRPHPEQGFRSCLGVMRLGKEYGAERLEAACRRAVSIKAFSYTSVKSILRSGLDRRELLEAPSDTQTMDHPNIRGSDYYH